MFEWVLNNVFLGVITQNVPIDMSFLVEVSTINIPDVVLIQDIIYFLFLVNREDLPVRIDATTTCSQNDFTSRMLVDEIGYVVDF